MESANLDWLYDLAKERELRIQPKRVGSERRPPLAHLNAAIKYASSLRKTLAKASKTSNRPAFTQRCAIRINYGRGGSVGKWYAVGRYISRESAVDAQTAFNALTDGLDMPGTMADWRRDGDELFFKMIVSPEFGYEVDLVKLTRETMADAEAQLGRQLEWMAVEHHNTDNPHLHVLIRGVSRDGLELRLPREFVQQGMRSIAEERTTNQLGYRSEQQIIEAQQREVGQARYTGLDRKLKQRIGGNDEVVLPPPRVKDLGTMDGMTNMHLVARLQKLRDMGLAKQSDKKDGWIVDPGYEASLRAMQKTVDRQKMMAAHGVVSSDKSLPFRKLSFKDVQDVEGRILVHGTEEQGNGIKNFVMVESITGEVLQVPHVREVDRARHHGQLHPGSYVRVKKTGDEPPSFSVLEDGAAESLLLDSTWLRKNGARLSQTIPARLGGWLGKMREASAAAAAPRRNDRDYGGR
jgi:type IV secretory pathway VirD2 relaxase